MPPHGYSTAELLALRSAPLAPAAADHSHRVTVPDVEYMAYHRRAVANQHAIFAFAHYDRNPAHPQLVVPELPHVGEPSARTHAPPVKWTADPPPRDLFTSRSRLARWLRYGRNVACFNLYPSSKRDLQVNDLLWRVAQEGEYLPEEGNLLLENNIFSLTMPHKFFTFLAGISQHGLKTCMLQVLALIAEDEDAEGLALMKSELEDSVWEDLTSYMADRKDDKSLLEGKTKGGTQLMRDVEMLLRLCYLSPWKIDVYAGYVTPQDMNMVLTEEQRALNSVAGPLLPALEACDRKLVRSSARRPVSFGPSIRHGSPPPRRGTRKTNTAMFWKLYQDWRRYRKVLVQVLGKHPTDVSQTMLHAIAQGNPKEAWDSAEVVMACAKVPGNLFSGLPNEVVTNFIAPYVLLAGSKD